MNQRECFLVSLHRTHRTWFSADTCGSFPLAVRGGMLSTGSAQTRQPRSGFFASLVVIVGLWGGCTSTSTASGDAGSTDAGNTDIAPRWQFPATAICDHGYPPAPVVRGNLSGDALVEVSGVVASPTHLGVLWMHNDSGDEAQLYAVSDSGALLGRLVLSGVDAVDFEDIAAAPCPDQRGPCLWIADTGDNARERAEVKVYAIAEPPVTSLEVQTRISVDSFWTFQLRYPTGPVDAEALVVLPDGTGFYVFEKTDAEVARVFRSPSPLRAEGVQLFEEIATLLSPGVDIEHGRMITGADLHRSGLSLVLRVYTGVYEYALHGPADLENLADREPSVVAYGPLTEPQGEAVAYDATGLGIWTVSEDPQSGGAQPLHFFRCQSP